MLIKRRGELKQEPAFLTRFRQTFDEACPVMQDNLLGLEGLEWIRSLLDLVARRWRRAFEGRGVKSTRAGGRFRGGSLLRALSKWKAAENATRSANHL